MNHRILPNRDDIHAIIEYRHRAKLPVTVMTIAAELETRGKPTTTTTIRNHTHLLEAAGLIRRHRNRPGPDTFEPA